jgi:hypothetical protein
MNAPSIRVTEFTAVHRNSLRGFATVVQPSGMVLHDVAIHQRDGTAWASPASKPMLDRNGQQMKGADGKGLWVPIISFNSKAVRDKWSGAIVDAVRQAYPQALE